MAPKDGYKNFDEDFIELRKDFLQRFLNSLLKNPEVKSSMVLKKFLSDPAEAFAASRSVPALVSPPANRQGREAAAALRLRASERRDQHQD
jgi:hypothetical protein